MLYNTLNENLISMSDLDRSDIEEVIALSNEIKKHPPSPEKFKGKVLGLCFFEPSTRTRISFETAMKRLGGDVIGFHDLASTSVEKGETLFDTIKMMEGYVDAIVIRHKYEGAAKLASEATSIPIINGGDGANQHPTQALLDLFSIHETQKKIDGLSIGCLGDLKFSRTIHSLVQGLSNFNVRLYFIAPPGLELPQDTQKELKKRSILFSFHSTLEEVLPKLDILYVTRLQKERIENVFSIDLLYKKVAIDSKLLSCAKPNLKILHPLPRVDELDRSIDHSSFAYYFEQAKNAIPVRQAILTRYIGESK